METDDDHLSEAKIRWRVVTTHLDQVGNGQTDHPGGAFGHCLDAMVLGFVVIHSVNYCQQAVGIAASSDFVNHRGAAILKCKNNSM